jgi:4-amino-4-deoxy-L-arabinose transferase-like glycosyltransferase
VLIATGIGIGLLAKGPIILIHVLLPAVLAPLWQSRLRQSAGRWFGSLALALLGGIAIVGAWVVPAAIRGGPAYTSAILWHQTADRMADSFAHARPWWFYVPLLPVMLLPWSAWPRLWRSARDLPTDAGGRFVLIWFVAVLIALSIISGKQPHYALPMIAAASLLVARAVTASAATVQYHARRADQRTPALTLAAFAVGGAVFFVTLSDPGVPISATGALWALGALAPAFWSAIGSATSAPPRRLAVATVLACMLIATGFFQEQGSGYDLRAPASVVGALQRAGATVVTICPDQGQLEFQGRFERPLIEVRERAVADWGRRHGGAYLVMFRDSLPTGVVAERIGRYPYRSGWITLWRLAGSPPTPAEAGPA